MKTVRELFKDQSHLIKEPAVQELITEYERVCDDLIDIQQSNEFNKEKPLKELIKQILQAVTDEMDRDDVAVRFKETDRVDFKNAVKNLQKYILGYLKDYQIRIN